MRQQTVDPVAVIAAEYASMSRRDRRRLARLSPNMAAAAGHLAKHSGRVRTIQLLGKTREEKPGPATSAASRVFEHTR